MLRSHVHFLLLAALLQLCDAFHRKPPATGALLLPQGQSRANAVLAKRADDCGNGMECRSGFCCGTGCSSNCCANDDGGIGCGDAERCDFAGNVFIGCCPISAVQGCTGTAASVYVTSPYRTITLSTNIPFTPAQPTYGGSTTSDHSYPTYTRADHPTPTSSQEFVPSATSIAHHGESSGGGKMSTGAKAGIGVGAAVGGIALGAAVGFFVSRMRNKKANPTSPAAYAPTSSAPVTEDKGEMTAGKAAYVPAYPSHTSELSGATETRRYEMPG